MGNYIEEPAKHIPVIAEVEVLVCGGGPAGMVAAVAAGRNGAKTLLLEHYGFLGGVFTSGNLITVKGFGPDQGEGPSWVHQENRSCNWYNFEPIVKGIPHELLSRLNRENAAYGDMIDALMSRAIFDDFVQESDCQILLHTTIVDVIKSNDQIKGVIIESRSGRSAILADVVIDATGDGVVAHCASVPCSKGRDQDGAMQPMTLCFTVADANYPWDDKCQRIEKTKWAELVNGGVIPAQRKAIKEGKLPESCLCTVPGVTGERLRKDQIWVNAIWQYGDATDAWQMTNCEIEGRKKVRKLFEFYKTLPGYENSYLAAAGSQIGIRESRRIKGEYILTEDDVLNPKNFVDSICKGCWQIDIHSPDGGKTPGRWELPKKSGQTYQIPYRILLPLGIERLLVAGRCSATTHEAFSSTRVAATCMAMGQAAGTAAALAVKNGVVPKKLDVTLLQRTLTAQGATIC